jgi:hypothetical protein
MIVNLFLSNKHPFGILPSKNLPKILVAQKCILET